MKSIGFSEKMVLIWMRNGFGKTIELLRSSDDNVLSSCPVLRLPSASPSGFADTWLSTLKSFGLFPLTAKPVHERNIQDRVKITEILMRLP